MVHLLLGLHRQHTGRVHLLLRIDRHTYCWDCTGNILDGQHLLLRIDRHTYCWDRGWYTYY